jgi:ribosomal protein S18 acetylase RimI-like enzyme
MNDSIVYKTNEVPGKEEFFHLFETTGWNEEYKLSAVEIHDCLQKSWYTVSAYDKDRLVGFGRIISDGKLHALITEMIVLPEYQGQSIGKEILKYLTDECTRHKIRDVQLFSAKGKAGFYEKYGFGRRPENGPGMEIKFKP